MTRTLNLTVLIDCNPIQNSVTRSKLDRGIKTLSSPVLNRDNWQAVIPGVLKLWFATTTQVVRSVMTRN